MIENKHEKYAAFNSDFLSATIEKKTARIAFLGIESGGRDRDKHASYNLTIPAYGAKFGAFKKSLPEGFEITDNSMSFKNAGGSSITYTMSDDRTLNVELDKVISSDIFSARFAIKTAPPTVWTKNEPKRLKSKDPLTIFKTRYDLPLIIHFPDFGRLEISATSDEVYCVEELQLSSDFAGLDLGYLNYSFNHNRMHALHYGSSFITLKSKKPLDKVGLTLKVLEECYPSFAHESDERYNGLKRNWLNAFAMNRELFDMGDNIYFHGTGHLAIHMKADLLQIMNGEDEQFKIIRRTFERQVERTFKESQSDEGEVSVCCFNRKKKQGDGCASDSTPGAIISLTGIASWNLPFAKKLLPNAIKAADFLLTFDSDGDGIFEVPFAGDYMGQPADKGYYCNWWDNFSFGHKDIYFNYLCHRALRELSELLERLGKRDLAKKYREQLAKFDKSFLDTFYNPETGLMAGWISRNGKVHDYGFTFAVSMGINEGLIPRDMGKKMIKLLLSKMKKEGYGDLRFGIPGNVVPVDPADTINWPCMSDWGRYENGGLNGMNGFHFLTAMYKVGLEREADEIMFAILNTYEKSMTHSGLMPGYCQSVDWRTKEGVPCGYNYLADNYYFLLAVYAGKCKMPHSAVVNKEKMRKIIDSHLHISRWGEADFISCFDDYVKDEGVHALNICAIPFYQSNVCNNIIMGFYKLARPSAYIHGGIELINIPIDNMPRGMDAVSQYKELMEIGFDGIKMLEGKPTEHKKIGKSLNHPSLNALYKEMEKDGTHLLMHVNDPDEFWDKDRAPDWAVANGWAYLDGTYSPYREIQNQTIKILKEHPNLTLTLAHFFFCSKEPEILEKLFSLYPNLCVDLTPGGEMYVEFEKNYEYYKEFFNKYSKRLIFGTDRSYLGDDEYANWLFNVVTAFLGTDKSVKSFDDKELKGLGLTQDKVDDIFFANFERRVGKAPKTLNKEKFKAYIEKYSFALTDKDKENLKPLMEKYL